MAKRHSRDIELTIISAESLSLTGNRRVKKNPFVVIKIESNADEATEMDTGNGPNPTWNQKFFMNMPMNARFLTLEVRCRKFSGDHLIGSAWVPTSDFDGGYFPMNYLHLLSYRLRDRNGERNGIINISIKINNNGQRISQGVAVGVPLHLRY
ncbi:BON1-associated protein 1-like [Cynara cardunculus var. scolymus]|uniref:C2 domain-containing protein n=1 Tax=Cynara cardunculus var. scolymus TaxID=59895 RepID=A0A103XI44_CYNCS|nr:BON1-associated protein 1-like [Cynara cardunculus var. scolymus]KVH91159.1 hypothetical protein Ccrd_006829 [Cynara cardunculus var. scolymus]